MDVRLTHDADEDLIDSYLYGLVTFGQDQADSYEASLWHAIDLIAENSAMGVEHPECGLQVRIHHHRKHYIIYRIEDDCVLIGRILRDEVRLTRYLWTA